MSGPPTRPLAGRAVSAVSLGCMNLSHAYGTPPAEADAIRLLNRALDLGINHLDTAALYGGGRNEALLARAVMHRRNEFLLASKCVLDQRDGRRVLDGSPAAITRTLTEALDRLKTDHIDLYYLHRLDRRVPIEDSVDALVRAREAGMIGAIGLSEVGADTIRRAHATHPIAAVQSEYSPIVRNPELAVLSACSDLDIAFVAFSPVARGLLAGAVRGEDFEDGNIRRPMPRFQAAQLTHNLRAIDRFDALARRLGCAPAQLSLAWLLARGPHVVALPGTTSIAHLEENLAAAGLALDPADLAQVDAIFAGGAIRGARYTAAMQAQIDTETFADEELV